MSQRGQLFSRSGGWYVRFYEDGRRVTKHLGYVKDYPSQRMIEPVMQDFMRRVNGSAAPSVTLEGFIRDKYLPHAQRELRPSVFNSYRYIYTGYVKGWPECAMRVREYNTAQCQAILNAIADDRPLTKATLQHIKFFFSGVFVYAAQCGVRDGNPMRETRVPRKAKAGAPTYAYSLAEIRKMLMVLPPHLKAPVAVAAYAGLRLSELNGLEWGDYTGTELRINRSRWRDHVSDPKTTKSRDYVPVIPTLKAILDEYRVVVTDAIKAVGAIPLRMFRPLAHAHRDITVWIKGTGVEWHGWHAFRRGLATNLYMLGADDLTVQRILRHSTVTVTREHYIKTGHAKMDAAMERLSSAVGPSLGQA